MSYTGRGGAVNDLVLLEGKGSRLKEKDISDCLENHFRNNEIYTYIGPVLISVNPYKSISGLYGRNQIKKFVSKKKYENSPHVYGVAESAYRAMVDDLANQCVVITGESGSGKTEASKKVMEYVAAMSNSKKKDIVRIKQQLLDSNPLLEAFGNAKTLRNDNSSRFGKYMQILFKVGEPAGGKITTYLLEKSRVVHQQKGERNFHIFYQLLSDSSKAKKYDLDPKGTYNYICDPSVAKQKSIDDAGEFQDTLDAMDHVQIDAETRHHIFQVVAFILHLGNVDFEAKGGDKGVKIKASSKKSMSSAAKMLNVEFKTLRKAITEHTLRKGVGAGKKLATKKLNVEEARDARDSMAKNVYNQLFAYIVQRANEAIASNKFSTSLGVLDIYGFEILGVNGFEQLCINYTNERLHQLFIQLTLKAEQNEYQKENIPWEKVKYQDNEPICRIIATAKPCVFSHLNDQVKLLGRGNHENFVSKVRQLDARYIPKTGAGSIFAINHYAGVVKYQSKGMVERNKDELFQDIVNAVNKAENPVATVLFRDGTADDEYQEVHANMDKAGRDARKPSAFKYVKSVNELLDSISQAEQHYIRCIKPNGDKSSSFFDQDLVLTQIKYLGVLENVIVRRAGYAFRMEYGRFASKYKCVLPDSKLESFNRDSKQVTETILKAVGLSNDAFKFGKTKIFIKNAKDILGLESKRQTFFQLAKSFLPPEEDGLMFADKVVGFDNKFQKHVLTFCVGGQGFYWYTSNADVAQYFPHEKLEFIGYNKDNGWMTINTSYASKQEGDRVQLCYLSDNIYSANVVNFVEVMKSMGYESVEGRPVGSYPRDAVEQEEYKKLVKQIAKGDKATVAKGAGLDGGPCANCCTIA